MSETQNRPADQFARFGTAAVEAMTDGMVERLAGTAGNTLELADKLNDPDIREGVSALLDAVGAMQRSGALGTLVEVVHLLHAVRSAASDSMIERAFIFVEHMVNTLGNEDLGTLAYEAKSAMEDAVDHCGIPAGGGGLFGSLRMLSRPDTQEAIRFMLAFACSLQKRSGVLSKAPSR
jgi:uncharacterized protein YjgD (DUF1641 family)